MRLALPAEGFALLDEDALVVRVAHAGQLGQLRGDVQAVAVAADVAGRMRHQQLGVVARFDQLRDHLGQPGGRRHRQSLRREPVAQQVVDPVQAHRTQARDVDRAVDQQRRDVAFGQFAQAGAGPTGRARRCARSAAGSRGRLAPGPASRGGARRCGHSGCRCSIRPRPSRAQARAHRLRARARDSGSSGRAITRSGLPSRSGALLAASMPDKPAGPEPRSNCSSTVSAWSSRWWAVSSRVARCSRHMSPSAAVAEFARCGLGARAAAIDRDTAVVGAHAERGRSWLRHGAARHRRWCSGHGGRGRRAGYARAHGTRWRPVAAGPSNRGRRCRQSRSWWERTARASASSARVKVAGTDPAEGLLTG